jgi:Gpi18-like mannosyltransferase
MRLPAKRISTREARFAPSSPKEPGVLPNKAPAPSRESRSTVLTLGALLLVALLVRLFFITSDGFKNDVVTFEAWALTLAEHPLNQFFAKAGFADYPPGYMYVLWIVGHLYKLLVHSDPTYGILKIFVKLPGIIADLIDAALIFAIVRRLSPSLGLAFAAFTLFAFNPAAIFVSAYWGQVDSVSAAFVLGAILLVIDAQRETSERATLSLAGAWVLVAASILIKPPAIVLVPLLVAFPFTTDDRTGVGARRLIASTIGFGASLVLAYLAALAFHPSTNPIDQFAWLYGRYQTASAVYAYSSVNAFNLYAMIHRFWESDSVQLLFLPQYVWAIGLFLVATALVVSRYIVSREPAAFLEAAMLLSLGYFVLLTRMHERYIYDAFILAMPLIALRRRYLWAAFLLSLTLLTNLLYSFYYLHVMNDKIPGLDPADLAPWLSHPMAALNVAIFFYLGFVFLGAGADPIDRPELTALWQRFRNVRHWFAPLAGVRAMTGIDWLIAGGMSLGSFVLTYVGYQFPPEKIFDEIYYARAGEEYLAHKDIFEYTHPPLTKLIVTASMWMFGGLHGAGDTSIGWRFLNLVVGALMVLVMYAFAKRLLGTTPFAALAAGFLLFDGFHYVQSRIATPEITVAFFSLLTLYAFYRFWIAAQVRVAPEVGVVDQGLVPIHEIAGVAAVTVVALLGAWLVSRTQPTFASATFVVTFLYFECGLYLAVRLLAPVLRKARSVVSYAEGSRVIDGLLHVFDGGLLGKNKSDAGRVTTAGKAGLLYTGDDLRIEYARTGSARYVTPEGEAQFLSNGTMVAGEATIAGARDGTIWMWILTVCAGCLAASKWNGLFDFFVVWFWVAIVVTQRHWLPLAKRLGAGVAALRPPVWGNPFGFSFDIVVAAMLFVGATIYVLTYIPYFNLAGVMVDGKPMGGHTLGELISLQQQMYSYHSTLTATHPYGSHWWQWPLLLRPISYYYHDFRVAADASNDWACCVAEIMALPNPLTWWFGLISVPFMAYLGWRERNKGYAILAIAYLFQWLPWILSPRVAFEYHFLPNLAVICLADAVLLQRIWRIARDDPNPSAWPRLAVYGFGALTVLTFAFFFPVLSGMHIPWKAWDWRMMHNLFGNNWV